MLSTPNLSRFQKYVIGSSLLSVVLLVSGCKTISFYGQAIKGQYRILAHQRPVNRLIADPKTPDQLKSRFELLAGLREFAEKELHLPVNGHYLKYVDVHRPFVVWNVEATPEFSMEPKTWWYPLVGRQEYRGYFSWPGATNYAGYLRRQGYDVAVGGVQAYSTLGWFKDPVLNTFIFEPDSELAELLFHELAHQRVFAHGDTDFNEAFATTVGQEGARRWLKACGDTAELERYLAHLRRNDAFVHLVMETRLRLESLFGDVRTEEGNVKATRNKPTLPSEQLRREKMRIYSELEQEFASHRQQWNADPEFDDWFTHPVNNAQLNSVAAYYDLVPGFERLLAANGGDIGKFFEVADRLSKRPRKERQEQLAGGIEASKH